MPKPFYKHRLLLDEDVFPRSAFPKLNELFDVKHIVHDLNLAGTLDEPLYKIATVQRRIVITFNGKDFRNLVLKQSDPGVIDVPASWKASHIDTKLTALLRRHGQTYFSGHFRTLATEA